MSVREPTLMTTYLRFRRLAIAVLCLAFIGFVAVPVARACVEDAEFSLIDGELPGGG